MIDSIVRADLKTLHLAKHVLYANMINVYKLMHKFLIHHEK